MTIPENTKNLALFVIKTESGTDAEDVADVLDYSLEYTKQIFRELLNKGLIEPCQFGYEITKKGLDIIRSF